MKILRHLKVPTGDILVVQGEHGNLELLSLGDYGKSVNLKADFLGLERVPEKVRHTKLLPFEEKWVLTISTQYGCMCECQFCDVPNVGRGPNATLKDLQNEILVGLKVHPEVHTSKHLNIHFARMGEPSFNPNVLDCGKWIKEHIDPEYIAHPVVSTMMPRHNIWLKTFVHNWMRIKNRLFDGNAGLQLSINSTDENERLAMFNGHACTLKQIGSIVEGIIPVGRKITLNFAVAGWTIDPEVLLEYFPPEEYICKLTPMHRTAAAIENGLETRGDATTYYPFEEHERALKNAGYDVIVFIASKEEDDGLITCGNAILSGALPRTAFEEVVS